MSATLLSAFPAFRNDPATSSQLFPSPSRSHLNHIMNGYHDSPSDLSRDIFYSIPSLPDPPPSLAHVSPISSSRGMVVVHSYTPAFASPGAPLTAQVDFHHNCARNVNVYLRIVFGDLALPTEVQKNPCSDRIRGAWSLGITVPPMGDASPSEGPNGRPEWHLTVQAIDEDGVLLDSVGFGLFAYESPSASPVESSISSPYFPHKARPASPNKRYRVENDDFSPGTSNKRIAMDMESMNLRRMPVASVEGPLVGSQAGLTANRVVLDEPSPPTSRNPPSGMSFHPQAFQRQLQLQTPAHHQHLPPDAFAATHTSEEYTDGGPALVRTTQLVSNGEHVAGAKATQASVAIQGDLEDMKCDWSEAERAAGRRLVVFWKRQVGTTLHISFDSIAQHQYSDNLIVVSCIIRDITDEYFITSVDVIYLLEALAGNRFEVEEKNRIRRNLEGFKPMTISKNKSGTEEFFKVIMEFPTPKPRNIEKDVKVFEWGKLKMMLEKVFSKYSTVPISPTSSLHYDAVTPGTVGDIPSYVAQDGTGVAPSNESPHPRASRSRSPKTIKKSSSGSFLQTDTHLSTPGDQEHLYSEPFVQSNHGDTIGYHTTLEQSDYPFGGIRFSEASSGLDSELLKVEVPSSGTMNGKEVMNGNADGTGIMGGHGAMLGIGGRPFDALSSPPSSSDNSPVSLTISLSSSSDGEQAESQDMARIPIKCGTHAAALVNSQ